MRRVFHFYGSLPMTLFSLLFYACCILITCSCHFMSFQTLKIISFPSTVWEYRWWLRKQRLASWKQPIVPLRYPSSSNSLYIWNLLLPVANISGHDRPLVNQMYGELEDEGMIRFLPQIWSFLYLGLFFFVSWKVKGISYKVRSWEVIDDDVCGQLKLQWGGNNPS